jgi:DNA modification methylase
MYQIIQGDCIEGMKTLPDQCVHTVITSPPYYGLRDYGTATWEGGDAECDHVYTYNRHGGERANRNQDEYKKLFTNTCGKCGAQRIDQQIGLEETPEAYVQRLVDVFREVRRILRDDGTVWLNLGDSYAGNNSQASNNGRAGYGNPRERIVNRISEGLKQKDLIGIPWRVAFALQADGWYLRQDIIWHKPNPMPESVTDRCTKSHEYIFLLSKSQRYYFDHEAIKEPVQSMGKPRKFRDAKEHSDLTMRNDNGRLYIPDEHRNKRSVWSVATKPYAEAHFAVYPTKLIEPCVLAGCPEGGTVFDPFTGSGTTALVALQYNRRYIGTELNPEYIALAEKRLSAVQICF